MVIFRIYSVGVFYVKYFHCNCQISLYFFHWVVFALEKRGSKAGIGIANPEFRLSKNFHVRQIGFHLSFAYNSIKQYLYLKEISCFLFSVFPIQVPIYVFLIQVPIFVSQKTH